MKSSSQKKWFRFTIGKLLLLIAASAIILAAYSQATYSYRQSRASANVIQAAGGSVLWSQSSFFRDATFPSIVQVDLQNCRLQDKEYAALGKIPDHFMLIIDSNRFDQETTRQLAKIERLSGLSLEPDEVAESQIMKFQEQRPDIIVMVGLNGSSSYRVYPRLGE